MKKILIVTAIIFNLASCIGQNVTNYKNMTMNNSELYKKIVNVEVSLFTRIESINQLNLSENKKLTINELKKLLNRQKPEPQPDLIDFDPVAEERVIDMHLIGVLNAMGDKSENYRIPNLISQAISFMAEFGDERKEDAKVIKSINDSKLIAEIIVLTQSTTPTIVENAVVVLNNLDLPNAPVGGDVSAILSTQKITFKFSKLKEEMELYVKESHGKIELSKGVKQVIETNNIQRGDDISLEMSLVGIIQKILPVHHLDYYVENGKIIICTYAETAERWQKWLKENP
ncbi:hypothetical protein [Apibacter sp. HY039]|uniref:hypothetical protein n=1 Tax=Apibacter sp. HY039 TaxID=2501476 RepID=UPI000FEBF333|nr:hypothetical protein [Apibacter sp. HY039]